MEDYNEQSNKAQSGADFNVKVLEELKRLQKAGLVEHIQMDKKISFAQGFDPQFHAPFLVSKSGNEFLIFKTNSARSDRIKENQWDAYGVKNHFAGKIKALLVLPDNLSEKEKNHAIREKERIKQTQYFSKIDEILFLSDLEVYFKNV